MSENIASLSSEKRTPRGEFALRALIFVGVAAGIILLFALLWQSAEVLLLAFAGLLLAVFLCSLADLVKRFTDLSETWSVAIVLSALVGIIALAAWLMYAPTKDQFEQLSETLPQAAENLRGQIAQSPTGRWFLAQLPQYGQTGGQQTSNVFGRVTGIFSTALGALVNILIVFVIGIYLAFSPRLYREGLLKLVPQSRQARAGEFLDAVWYTLQSFLFGISGAMIINGTLTGIGLWLLGVPFPIPLAIIAGLLSFIPNIGPISASVPAILIALTQSPTQAFYVALVYLAVQNLDGFIVTPLMQQRAVSLPPVLVIASQLLLGILFGFTGVVLAVPLVAAASVAVKMLYVEDFLGNRVEVKGEKQAKENQAASA